MINILLNERVSKILRPLLENIMCLLAWSSNNEIKVIGLEYKAKKALRIKKYSTALELATVMLSLIEDNSDSFGNAIHHGNLILGELSFINGDIDEAKKHLLLAGSTCGSPQLDSFGPSMRLAKLLIEKGEISTVLEYFIRCSKFWEHGKKHLNYWSYQVESGQVPDFGSNMNS